VVINKRSRDDHRATKYIHLTRKRSDAERKEVELRNRKEKNGGERRIEGRRR
jgi:hypothetical protein